MWINDDVRIDCEVMLVQGQRLHGQWDSDCQTRTRVSISSPLFLGEMHSNNCKCSPTVTLPGTST